MKPGHRNFPSCRVKLYHAFTESPVKLSCLGGMQATAFRAILILYRTKKGHYNARMRDTGIWCMVIWSPSSSILLSASALGTSARILPPERLPETKHTESRNIATSPKTGECTKVPLKAKGMLILVSCRAASLALKLYSSHRRQIHVQIHSSVRNLP